MCDSRLVPISGPDRRGFLFCTQPRAIVKPVRSNDAYRARTSANMVSVDTLSFRVDVACLIRTVAVARTLHIHGGPTPPGHYIHVEPLLKRKPVPVCGRPSKICFANRTRLLLLLYSCGNNSGTVGARENSFNKYQTNIPEIVP